jgi:hypothetical protein
MNRAARFVSVTTASLLFGGIVGAQAPAKTTICRLLPRAEVKALLGATDAFDRVDPRSEESKTGLSCSYAGLFVMVHDGGTVAPPAHAERIEGVGKEAFLVSSPAGVELFAHLGTSPGLNQLTISRRLQAGETAAAGRSGVIAVAKALIAKIQ